MRKVPGSFSIVCLVVLLAGCTSLPASRPIPTFVPPPTLSSQASGRTYIVRQGGIAETLQVRGRVLAVREALLYFPVSGWLKAFPVSPGEEVAKGALIAEMDSPALEVELLTAQHEAKVSVLSAEQARMQASYQGLALNRAELAQNRRVEEAEQALGDGELRLASAREQGRSLDVQIRLATYSYTQTRIALERAWGSYQAVSWMGGGGQYEAALDRLEQADRSFKAAEADIERLKIEKHRNDLEIARLAKVVEDATARLTAERQLAETLAQEAAQLKDSYQLNIQQAQEGEKYRGLLLSRAEERYASTRLSAPFSGTIVSVDAKAGDSLEPYESIGAIADPTELEVEAGVPEVKMDSVAVGQKASIVLDAYPQKRYQGRVEQLSLKPTTWQGKTVYNVRIGFDPGEKVPAVVRMGAEIEIVTRRKDDVLLVPVEAIYTEGDRSFVEVLAGGGRRRVQVEKGLSDGRFVEITGGLKEGDELVIS